MRALLVAAMLMAGVNAAAAQPFAGKTVTMVIGFGPGGGYDLWGRTVGRHIGKHLPGNPSVVPQNMPGAGSYVAASHIYNAAPKDGTVMGIIARDVALGPLTGAPGARFDATKFSWLGSPATEHNVCIANSTAAVKSANDLRDKELVLGDTGPGTGTRSYPKVLNDLLGYKFKLVSGFRSSADVFLAMERGEVDGICESLDSIHNRKPDWIPQKKVTCCCRAVSRRIRACRACRSCSTSRATPRSGSCSSSSTRGRASGGRSWRRPTSARPVEDAARCVQRDDEGPGVPGRRQEEQARRRAGGRRAPRGADRENLRNAEANRRAGGQSD